MCWSCESLPAPGSKLRYCGRYEAAAYCSKAVTKQRLTAASRVHEQTGIRAHLYARAFVKGARRHSKTLLPREVE
jgi:hypothetical protein